MASYVTENEFRDLCAADYDACRIDNWLPILEAASRLVDSYIGRCVDVPLVSPDANIKRIVCKIAIWDGYSGKVGFDPESRADIAIRQGYTDAMEWLKTASDCALDIGGGDDDDDEGTSGGAGSPVVMANPLRGW